MPAPPSGLGERLALRIQPAVILGGGVLFLNRPNKWIDDLHSDLKDRQGKLAVKIVAHLNYHLTGGIVRKSFRSVWFTRSGMLFKVNTLPRVARSSFFMSSRRTPNPLPAI